MPGNADFLPAVMKEEVVHKVKHGEVFHLGLGVVAATGCLESGEDMETDADQDIKVPGAVLGTK